MTKFTPQQQQVIDLRGKNLIVSAAAGSGKTTVMIERIKELIVKEHVPIENFLVVTFTKASSIDMKSRLIKSLSSLEPDTFILEQIDSISTADVSNLHSFCARLLKSYFYVAGIDPTFVVLSEEETDNLKQKALNKLFDEEFEKNNVDFFNLLDVLQKNRSDRALKEYILKMYDFFNVILDRESWHKNWLKLYDTNINKNLACNIINGYVCSRIQKLNKQIEERIVYYNSLKLTPLVEYLQNMQSALCAVKHSNGFAKNAQIIFDMPSFGVPPKVDEALEDYRQSVDSFREKIKAEIKNFKSNFISPNAEELSEQLLSSKTLANALYNSACRFEEIYAGLKREKCGLDYNDLEQYTLKVLEDSQVLEALKQKYKYVFVDEYQDINAIQEKIISLLSGENNRFMVGDIKQSIYRFRLCDPEIFLDKYNKYKTSDNSKAIDLAKNFRSNKHILDFVNAVFADRMTEDFGGVDYKNTANLVAGATFDQEDPVNLCYIDSSGLSESKKLAGKVEIGEVYSVKNHRQTEELENLKFKAEAEFISSEILDLVANKTIFDNALQTNRPIRFKDIAILLPARNEFLDCLLETFAKYNIPASTDASVDVLSDEYIKAIYNYLKLIYNYKQDIELFSCLYSPLFKFSLTELAQLRIYDPNSKYFYQCLQNVQNLKLEDELSEKLQDFNNKLLKYKKLAGYKTIKQVVQEIISDFSIENLMLTNSDGKQRLNLLNKFLQSLPEDNIYEYFNSASASITAQKGENTNAVQIVTIHKSKGLEYNIAFVANIGRTFNMQGMHGDVLISRDHGVGINYFDSVNRKKNNTVAKEAIKLTETRKLIEEQQRLLYVALTRAINKLYVVGCVNFNELHYAFPERPNSFSDWFDIFVHSYLTNNTFDIVNIICKQAEDLILENNTLKKPQITFNKPDKYLQMMVEESINYNYPYKKATLSPQKTSVTQIASGYHESEEIYLKYNISADNSSTEKGNAYHKLMQYINFESNNPELLEKNITKLINSGKLLTGELDYINKQSILKLLNNPQFLKIIKAPIVLREKEFFVNTGKTDIQIVQGVVDLVAINGSSAVVIDYKTGRFNSKQNLEKYNVQLKMYADAIEKSYNVKVKEMYIVAVEQGEVFEL